MIAPWRVLCLAGLGGFAESLSAHTGHAGVWLVMTAAGAIGWSWAAVITGLLAVRDRLTEMLTGRAPRRAATDPKAMAAEIASLRAQLAQLRDTAHSYDLSFDDTLHRLDERLRTVEHSSEPAHRIQRIG
jgi:hypothetical protein